jgi:hypothetical protein
MKIIERTHDITTGETTDVERDLTAAEIAEIEAKNAKAEAKAEAEASKAAQKSALLKKLGITADEAALLLS